MEPGLSRLSRGSESVAIEPRTMDLLVYLAQRAGETVAKEALLEEVWKGAFVEDGVIAKSISALRSALGDDAAAPTYILTVPRRGYRLVAPVRGIGSTEEGPAARDSALSTSPRAESEIRIPATNPPQVRQRGRRNLLVAALGVLLVGFLAWLVQASGKRSAAVPDRSRHLASESVERLLLEARHLWSQRGVDSIQRAHRLLLQAAREAPESAEARAWLALSLVTRANYLGGEASACDAAAEQVAAALALDPDNPVAHCARGVVALHRDFDVTTAIAAQERSVTLDPAFVPARQYLAEALSIAGRDDEALAVIEEAMKIEPLSAILHGVKGLILLRADRPLGALDAYDRVLVLEPKFTWVHHNRGMVLARLEREREAAEAFYVEVQSTHEQPEHLATLRASIDRQGLVGYWSWRVGRMETVRSQGAVLRSAVYAEALAGAGRDEAALVELARAQVCPDAEFFFYLRDSPAFDALRDRPEFVAIYEAFEHP